MATAVGTDDKKSVNVELNIVPFIDLMSCLTAFLLVTAVWVNTRQLPIAPKGHARDAPPCAEVDDCDKPKLSLLVEHDDIWIGVSRVNDFERIPRIAGGGYDWPRVEERLKVQKASPFFNDKTDIEIAASSTKDNPIAYQQLISAMDVAVKAGFLDVGLTQAEGLSARPEL
jgi:biopolymer transport protein ExbD